MDFSCKEVKCPICEKNIDVEVYEWLEDSKAPTPDGFHIYCGETIFDMCEWTFDEVEDLSTAAYNEMIKNNFKVKQ